MPLRVRPKPPAVNHRFVVLAIAVALLAQSAARGESPAAFGAPSAAAALGTPFGRQCVAAPTGADCVAPLSNIPEIAPHRAQPARWGPRPAAVTPFDRGPHGADYAPWGGEGRLATFGATPDSHHGLLEAAPARNFIWKATGKQGVVYLVGSVHVLTKDFYPLSPTLETAYKQSDLLVEEVDLGDMQEPGAQFQMLSRGMLPSNQSLDKLVSPATFAAVSKRFTDIGMPIEPLKRFKPWLAALTLMAMEWQKAGFDAELGLDKHFYDRAKADGKNVEGLETIEYQLSRFDEMSAELQDRLLVETLKGLDTEQANMTKLVESWRAGDAAAVERIVLKDLEQEAQLYQRLLVERNKNWLPKLEALFARKAAAFVVVGAAHLVGPDGLVVMLKAKGYTVEQQ